MSKRTPSIAIIVEAYGEWGDSDREVVKRIKRANIAIDRDTAQAVAIEREAIAGWLESKAEWLNANDIEWRSREVTRVAHLIRNGEHVKP